MSTTEISAEESACLATLAALTEWFLARSEGKDEGEVVAPYLLGQNPLHLVEFLFGFAVANIDNMAQVLDVQPEEYIQMMAVRYAEDVYTSQ